MHTRTRRLLEAHIILWNNRQKLSPHCFALLWHIVRFPALSRRSSWLLLSWRPGTWALPCSTARRPSWRQSEPSSTPRCSTSSTSRTTRSLPSTYPSSCPCVCLFCSPCSKSCLSSGRGAERNRPRRTESKRNMKGWLFGCRAEQRVFPVCLLIVCFYSCGFNSWLLSLWHWIGIFHLCNYFIFELLFLSYL